MSSYGIQKGGSAGNLIDAMVPDTNQSVAFSGTSAQSDAVGTGVNLVRLTCDQDCYVEFGENPTATSASMPLFGGVIEYFGIKPGHKIAVIQKTASGTLWITEGAVT